MKRFLSVLVLALVVSFGVSVFAVNDTDTQTINISIPDIAVLRATQNNVNLAVSAPVKADAGAKPLVTEDVVGGYLRYTSVTETGKSRSITVAITSGTLPTGISILLTATAPAGGTGTLGSSAGQITLSATAQNLITGITTGWTGTATSNGAELTYDLAVDNASIVVGNSSVVVTFTLTDAA